MFIAGECPGVRKELPFPLSELKCLFSKLILRSQIKYLREEIRNSDGTWFAFLTASGSAWRRFHMYTRNRSARPPMTHEGRE